jgi:hypothetical protein
MKRLGLTGMLAAVTLLACDDESVAPCPLAPVGPAIRVTVTAAATGAALTASAAGLVTEGTYSDSLRVCDTDVQGTPTARCAAWGRAGTYAVSLSAAGYAPWDTSGVFVPRGRCENGTIQLDVRLQLISSE